MTFAALIRSLPDDLRINFADVGSAGGLHKRWLAVRPIVSALLFDPREGGEVKRQGDDVIYPIALGAEPGTATLNLTALPNMSSTLRPNSALLETFRKKGGHTRIVDTVTFPVDTLDALAAREARKVDAIKVDTQGSEMAVLRGASECLASSILVAEVEVSFFQRYEGQALAGDIIAFMADKGFELLDLYRLKRYRRLNRADIGNISLGGGQRAGRLAYGDAIFFLEEKSLLERVATLPAADAENMVLKAIVALLIYGKPDMAARLFDIMGDRIGEQRRAEIARYLASLRHRWLRSGVAHHVLDYLGRHA